jgi:hypothetical protein
MTAVVTLAGAPPSGEIGAVAPSVYREVVIGYQSLLQRVLP